MLMMLKYILYLKSIQPAQYMNDYILAAGMINKWPVCQIK